MLERKFGDNTTYTLTVDEMAGVYDMLEESHFPISVTFTFLAEWFRSAGFHGTADEMFDVLNGYLEDENKLLKYMSCKCANEEADVEPYTDMRPFVPSHMKIDPIAEGSDFIGEYLSRIPGGPIPEDFILKEQEKARKRAKEEGENDQS